jgi:hypothetical protein
VLSIPVVEYANVGRTTSLPPSIPSPAILLASFSVAAALRTSLAKTSMVVKQRQMPSVCQFLIAISLGEQYEEKFESQDNERRGNTGPSSREHCKSGRMYRSQIVNIVSDRGRQQSPVVSITLLYHVRQYDTEAVALAGLRDAFGGQVR